MPDNSCAISRFEERDIDVLLAEELRVNPEFSRWFVHQGGGGFDCNHPAVRVDVSVFEDGSEVDVVADFLNASGSKFRLFVEDKITSKKMPEQLERYIRRARNEADRGEISGWTIKLFSPAAYWDRGCPAEIQHVSFEDAATFLRRSSSDRRIAYRADFLSSAAVIRSQQQRDAHNAETQPYIKEFWDAVYDMLEDRFPGYFIHKTQYPVESFFAPTTHGLPAKLLRVDFKGHKGEVDLAFKNCNARNLAAILAGLPEVPGRLVENQKSAAIRIDGLPKFTIADGIAVIEDRVLPAYEATHALLEFWKRHEARLRTAFET